MKYWRFNKESKKVDQRNSTIAELNESNESKNLRISALEADKWDLELKTKELTENLRDVTGNYNVLTAEQKVLLGLCNSYGTLV